MDRQLISEMRKDWNARAAENARHYIQNANEQWGDREFFRSGEISVANEIMPDMVRICGGRRSPLELNILEIGCGIGRMTRMLARIFGEVTALDISDEMLAKAKVNLRDWENVRLVLGDGHSLAGMESDRFDFAFSFIVFQHIPALTVIESYCKEVFRVLKPGGLFKFQVQGASGARQGHHNTWNGISISLKESEDLAENSGFDMEAHSGAGTQYFWLTFRKT